MVCIYFTFFLMKGFRGGHQCREESEKVKSRVQQFVDNPFGLVNRTAISSITTTLV